MALRGISVCIFDVNGVLLDSNLANAQAMAQGFTDDPGMQERIIELYLKLTGIDRGQKIRIIQDQIVGRPFQEGEFERRWERFKGLGRWSMLKAPLTDGCSEVLAAIGKRRITRVALSNTPATELQETLEAHHLGPLLDLVRGGGDWPKSESLKQLLKEFQFAPIQCLFFGDGKGDLAAARQAGVPFVAIDSGTGQFDTEEGFAGPYGSLAEWGREVLGMDLVLRVCQPLAKSKIAGH
jgi:phosphoglycolate phosphatase-like HAD superfamily hydrolase